MLSRERANELLIKTIKKYVALEDSVGGDSKPLNNQQVSTELEVGRKELKELGLNFDDRRK